MRGVRDGKTSGALLIVVASCSAGVVMVVTLEHAPLSFLASVLLLLVVIVAVHKAAVRRTGDRLNLLSATAGFYAVAFLAGSLYAWLALRGGASRLPGGDITTALWLATAGLLCFAVGYLVDPLRILRSIVPRPTALADGSHARLFPAALLFVGWAARLLQLGENRYFHTHSSPLSQNGTTWFIFVMTLLPLAALAIVTAEAFDTSASSARRGSARTLFVLLFLCELAWALPTGSRADVIEPIGVVVIARYYVCGRLPSLRIVLLLTLVGIFVLFPLLASYRSGEYRSSPGGSLAASAGGIRASSPRALLHGAGVAVARFSDVVALARVVQEGRSQMSYSGADTFRLSLSGFVPRALDPEKQNPGAFENEFGRAYGFIAQNNYSTAIAMTQPGELYLGGGWLGILLGMPLLGSLLRVFDEYLAARRADRGVLAIYAVLAPQLLIGLESSIPIGFVGTLKAGVFLALLVVVLGGLAGGAIGGQHSRLRAGTVS